MHSSRESSRSVFPFCRQVPSPRLRQIVRHLTNIYRLQQRPGIVKRKTPGCVLRRLKRGKRESLRAGCEPGACQITHGHTEVKTKMDILPSPLARALPQAPRSWPSPPRAQSRRSPRWRKTSSRSGSEFLPTVRRSTPACATNAKPCQTSRRVSPSHRAINPSPVVLRLMKAPEHGTLSPRERAVQIRAKWRTAGPNNGGPRYRVNLVTASRRDR